MSKIINRWTDEIICEDENKTIRQLAIENQADLSGANLRSADLRSADLSGANLRSADLSGANLRSADLSGADLSGANLRSADLSGADLSGADLSGANLRSADLSGADLSGADLSGADLSGANLRSADLSGADLSGADLSGADLSGANLRSADLRSANLRSANLRSADLSGADLSGAKHLLKAAEFLSKFESDELGLIVYKRLQNHLTQYIPPPDWVIEPGAIIEENPNPNRTDECGCGVNFGTLDWVQNNYTKANLWKCRIRWIDLADVVVPFNTDGKARCAKLELIEIIEPSAS